MNFNKSNRQQSHSENNVDSDFQKLMEICNSYGLNEQQTNQLINQFKKGALFSPENSFNDSLNQSVDLTFSQKHEQQYSFKHPKDQLKQQIEPSCESNQVQQYKNRSKEPSQYSQQSKMDEDEDNENDNMASLGHLQHILSQKFAIEKSLVRRLQEENIKLKDNLQQKDNTIDNLLSMKKQDTQIILGLKDIITNLTITLKEKQISFKDLQDKYTNMMESRVRELSMKKSLATQVSEPDLQDSSNIYINRQNQKMRSNNDVKQLRERELGHNQLKKIRASNKIDVKKYKEMIQNLRSNF